MLIGCLCWARKTHNSCRNRNTHFKTFPLDSQRTSAWYSNIITSASISLLSSESIQCFFWMYANKIHNFHFIVNNSCRITMLISSVFQVFTTSTSRWIKQWFETHSGETFLIFRITPFVERCMAAAPSVVTVLHFVQSIPCFSKNWFSLSKIAWAVALTPGAARVWYCGTAAPSVPTPSYRWHSI